MVSTVQSMMRAVGSGHEAFDAGSIDDQQLKWVISTGLGALLRYIAFDHLHLLPTAVEETLLRAELQAKIDSKLRRQAMTGILDSCEGRLTGGFTLLKGISISEQYYPEPHLRPMVDIDFLVSREDVPTVESALVDLGYRQGSNQPASFYEAHHHTMPFIHPKTRVRVEVHTDLLPPSWELARADVFSPLNVRRESLSSTLAGRPVFRLSNELQLLLIASDISWGRWVLGKPTPLFDVLYLLRGAGPDFDWDRVMTWMDHPELLARVSLLGTYLERRRLIGLPPDVTETLKRGARRIGRLPLRILHGEIERQSVEGHNLKDRLGLHNRQIVWDTLMAQRSPWLKLLMLPWNLAFPPGYPDRFAFKLALRRLHTALRFGGRNPKKTRPADRD